MASVRFSTNDLDEHPANDTLFPPIQDALTPNTGVSLQSAAYKIASLLPEDEPDSPDATHFISLCIEVSQLIPYENIVAMRNLISLLMLVLNDHRYMKGETWTDDAGNTHTRGRYSDFIWRMSDEYPSQSQPGLAREDFAKSISFHTFSSYLCERDDLPVPLSQLLYTLRAAFEEPLTSSGELRTSTREALVMASAQHIVIVGRKILDRLINAPRLEISTWFAGPLFPQSVDPKSIDRWRFWRDAFRAVFAGTFDVDEKQTFREEVKEAAGKAAQVMDRIEAEVGPWTRNETADDVAKDTRPIKTGISKGSKRSLARSLQQS